MNVEIPPWKEMSNKTDYMEGYFDDLISHLVYVEYKVGMSNML